MRSLGRKGPVAAGLVSMVIGGAVVCAPAGAALHPTVCSTKGLTPALRSLKTFNGITCATARTLPGAALKKARVQQRFGPNGVTVGAYSCNVIRLRTTHRLISGNCRPTHNGHGQAVFWHYA